MKGDLTWHVGKEADPGERLDKPPYRAYFYWKRDGQLLHASDFSEIELEAEIQRLKQLGEDTGPFEDALRSLRNFK